MNTFIKRSKPHLRKMFKESSLIVFSVLVALFINQLASDFQTRKKKDEAIRRIEAELTSNRTNIKNVIHIHKALLSKLEALEAGQDSTLRYALLKSKGFDMKLIYDGVSLWPAKTISITSWEAAKSTGIISEFDYSDVERYTAYYDVMQILTQKSVHDLIAALFVTFLNEDEMDIAIRGATTRLNEVISQEHTILSEIY